MKKILIGISLLFFAAAVQAQTGDTLRKIDESKFRSMYFLNSKLYNDSIYIYSNGFTMSIKTRCLVWLTEPELQLKTLLEDFQRVYAAQKDYLPQMNHYQLSYAYYFQNIIKKELNSPDEYFYQPSSNIAKKVKKMNECYISSPGVEIVIHFMNDSLLLDPRFPGLIQSIVDMKTRKEWNKLSVAWVNNIDSSDNRSPFNENMKKEFTYTEKIINPSFDLHLSAGLATTKSSPTLLTEVKFEYQLDNAGSKIGYSLSYDWNFSFAENGTRYINSFVNLSGLEEGFLPKLKTMAGIDMGYLVFRQGDVYEKNTFRLGFAFKGDFWYLSPQIYFPGKFKGVYPGLRLLIGI